MRYKGYWIEWVQFWNTGCRFEEGYTVTVGGDQEFFRDLEDAEEYVDSMVELEF